jgi:ERF superfamily
MIKEKTIYSALADFQQEVPVISKDTSGYNYKYADLPKIFETINPLLKKHGLGFYQAINGSSIKTVIFHVDSNTSIESITDIPFDSLVYEEVSKVDYKTKVETKVQVIKGFEGMNRAQAIGSLITYFRRYSLSSILGLVTDVDTDGTGFKTAEKPKVGTKGVNAEVGEPFEESLTGLN